MEPAKLFCSYCSKDLMKTNGNKGEYKVALFLKSGDSIVQVCDDCAIKVFVHQILSEGVCTECLIDTCDNVLLRG